MKESLNEIYALAVEFVEGKKITSFELYEIMYNSKEYTVHEICYIIDRLYSDGFINR